VLGRAVLDRMRVSRMPKGCCWSRVEDTPHVRGIRGPRWGRCGLLLVATDRPRLCGIGVQRLGRRELRLAH
jgi:hypothetical protein